MTMLLREARKAGIPELMRLRTKQNSSAQRKVEGCTSIPISREAGLTVEVNGCAKRNELLR